MSIAPMPFTAAPVVVAVPGELDIANAPAVDAALRAAEASGAREIVLDLTELSFMGSVGLRLILEADERARAQGHRLTLRSSAAVRRVTDLAGLSGLLEPIAGCPACGEDHERLRGFVA